MSSQPGILAALGVSLLVATLFALGMGSRGGRYRALPGWIVFWLFFGALLVVIARAPRWASLPLLGVVMFGCLREYTFLAPVRPQDRWAVLLAYGAILACLYPVYVGSFGLFMTVIILALFLLMPALLSLGTPREGLLDSMGRVMLGLLVYVFSAAHLGWMVELSAGRVELFAVLALAAELPQRLAGRLRPGEGMLRSAGGMVLGLGLAGAAGGWLGPWVEIATKDGVVAGLLVAVAVTVGGLVTEAVAQDLSLEPAAARVGRAALLDRITPAIYAAPLYFHFVSYFAGQ